MTVDLNDKIFDFIYREAMDDATKRAGIKSGSKEKFLSFDNKELNEAQIARNKVRNYVDSVLGGDDPSFDFYADMVIYALSEIDDGFNYGNAQKLINITVKYFYAMNYNCKNESIRDRFSCCHCPMDRRLISVVVKKYRTYLNNNPLCTDDEKDLIVCEKDGNGIKTWDAVNWTDINNDTKYLYDKFQAMVRILSDEEGLIPIEFDYKYWK